MNTIKIDKKQVKMIAHRGVSGLERENTNLAFVAAGNRSYFGVETDVHVTSDGHFIVIHDNTTKRVAGEDYPVEETDFATLRSLRLFDLDGRKEREDLRLPTLEEYIRICKKYEKVCVLELKRHIEEEDIGRIVERIREEDYLDQVIFISFHFENLVALRKFAPNQPAQFLFSEFTDEIIADVKKHGFDVDVAYHALTEEKIRQLHEAGILVNCWTVNDPEEAEKLVSWGVDFITTNILE